MAGPDDAAAGGDAAVRIRTYVHAPTEADMKHPWRHARVILQPCFPCPNSVLALLLIPTSDSYSTLCVHSTEAHVTCKIILIGVGSKVQARDQNADKRQKRVMICKSASLRLDYS